MSQQPNEVKKGVEPSKEEESGDNLSCLNPCSKVFNIDNLLTPRGMAPPLPLPMAPRVPFVRRPSSDYAKASKEEALALASDKAVKEQSPIQGPPPPPLGVGIAKTNTKTPKRGPTYKFKKSKWLNIKRRPDHASRVATPEGRAPPAPAPNAPVRDGGPRRWHTNKCKLPASTQPPSDVNRATVTVPPTKIVPKYRGESHVLRRCLREAEIPFSEAGSPLMASMTSTEGVKACINIPLADGRLAVVHPLAMESADGLDITPETKIELMQLKIALDTILEAEHGGKANKDKK